MSDLCLHLSPEDCSRNQPKSHFINGIKKSWNVGTNEEWGKPKMRPFTALTLHSTASGSESAVDAAASCCGWRSCQCNSVHGWAAAGAEATSVQPGDSLGSPWEHRKYEPPGLAGADFWAKRKHRVMPVLWPCVCCPVDMPHRRGFLHKPAGRIETGTQHQDIIRGCQASRWPSEWPCSSVLSTWEPEQSDSCPQSKGHWRLQSCRHTWTKHSREQS